MKRTEGVPVIPFLGVKKSIFLLGLKSPRRELSNSGTFQSIQPTSFPGPFPWLGEQGKGPGNEFGIEPKKYDRR